VPGRLDRVQVATSLGAFEIPWASRDALLDHLAGDVATQDIRDAFVAVRTSRPVALSRLDRAVLVNSIDVWSRDVGGTQRLPGGIWELRNELAQDMLDID